MKKKAGFALIEIIISLGIISGICIYTASFITHLAIENHNFLNHSKQEFYIDEGLNFIQYLAENSNEFTVVNNKIKLKRADNTSYDWIRKDLMDNIILCYGGVYGNPVNTVVKNIKDFKVNQVGRVVYVKIIDKKGVVYCKSIIKE